MPPNKVREALNEIRFSIDKIFMLDVFLETAIVFLVGYLLISVSGLRSENSILAVTGIALLYFIIFSWKRIRINKIKLVEKKFSKLNEKITTANDYLDENNDVVNELHREVIMALNDVDEGSFMQDKAVFLKSIIVAGFCFLILFLAPIDIQRLPIMEQARDLANVNIKITPIWPQQPEPYGGGPSSTGLGASTGSIYGQKKLIALGNIEKQLDLRATSFELNVKDVQDVQDQEQFGDAFPSEIVAQSSVLSEEEKMIPKDQQEIVKQYFRISAEG